MSTTPSEEIVAMWDAINAYAAVWRHPEYIGVDRQKAVVAVGSAIDALVARRVEEERLRTARNLALVEIALRDEAGADDVRKITGGSAPEQVQGILDSVTALRAAVREAIDAKELD